MVVHVDFKAMHITANLEFTSEWIAVLGAVPTHIGVQVPALKAAHG